MKKLMKKLCVTTLTFAALWLGMTTASFAETEGMRLAWAVDIGGATHHAPLVVGNKVLVVPDDGPLTAVDASTGKVQWTYGGDGGSWSKGLSSNGSLVFVCLKDGKFAALNATDGAEVWKIDLGINCQRPAFISGKTLFVPTTLVGSGLMTDVYTGAKLFSINASDGRVNWAFTTGNYFLQTPFEKSGQLYVGGNFLDPNINVDEGGLIRIYALDSKSAKVRWTFESEDGTPKGLYATDKYFVMVGYQDFMTGFDASTGKQLWRRDTENWVPALSGMGDVVFHGSANTKVKAWDMATGETQWRYDIKGASFDYLMRYPVPTGDRLYFIAQRGRVFAMDQKTGEEIWIKETGIDSRGFSVDGKKIYISDSRGRVYAYEVLK